MEHRVEWLEKSTATHDNLIYTNERYLRRNNARNVGVRHSFSENCIDIARKLLNDITNIDIKMERSHRDGRKMHGKDRHILIKLSYNDKMDVMENAKQALQGKSVYVIHDQTSLGLKKKKGYIEHINRLCSTGVKLRFYNGRRRLNNGNLTNLLSCTIVVLCMSTEPKHSQTLHYAMFIKPLSLTPYCGFYTVVGYFYINTPMHCLSYYAPVVDICLSFFMFKCLISLLYTCFSYYFIV